MAGDLHFYSISAETPAGYIGEGVVGLVFPQKAPGTVPLYRFVQTTNGAHFYSLSSKVPTGYAFEKIECWLFWNFAAASPLPALLLYRFYKPGSDDHFYNTKPDVPPGYIAEGSEGVVLSPDASGDGRKPLYRYYNSSNGFHFYSLSPVTPAGYVSEPPVGYAYTGPGPDRVQLHRFLNVYTGGHFYTTANVLPDGYVEEEEKIFVLAAPDPGGDSTALCRFYNPALDDHFYSADPTVPPGYQREQDEGFVMISPGIAGVVPLYRYYMPEVPGEKGWLESAWDTVTGAAETVWEGVTGAASYVFEVAISVFGTVLGYAASLFDLLAIIPYVGRFFELILNLARSFIALILSIPNLIAMLFGIEPDLKLRVAVVVPYSDGQPLVRKEVVVQALNYAIATFRDRASVRIYSAKGFTFSAPDTITPDNVNDFIFFEEGIDASKFLSVGRADDGGALVDNLGDKGSEYQRVMLSMGYGKLGASSIFRRFTGYGSPVFVFPSLDVEGTSYGTSLTFVSDYVFVEFGKYPSTMAHEMAHACGAFWHEEDPEDVVNLMYKPASGRIDNQLNSAQKAFIRTSRHTTNF